MDATTGRVNRRSNAGGAAGQDVEDFWGAFRPIHPANPVHPVLPFLLEDGALRRRECPVDRGRLMGLHAGFAGAQPSMMVGAAKQKRQAIGGLPFR